MSRIEYGVVAFVVIALIAQHFIFRRAQRRADKLKDQLSSISARQPANSSYKESQEDLSSYLEELEEDTSDTRFRHNEYNSLPMNTGRPFNE